MTDRTDTERRCLGFGARVGCTNKAGCPRTPHWCAECNQLRMDHISSAFAAILDRMSKDREP